MTLLANNSNENRPLSTKEIIDLLSDMGISCERKTLYNDIETLIKCGFNISPKTKKEMSELRKKFNSSSNLYYAEKQLVIKLDESAAQLVKASQEKAEKEKLIVRKNNLAKLKRKIEERKKPLLLCDEKTDAIKYDEVLNELSFEMRCYADLDYSQTLFDKFVVFTYMRGAMRGDLQDIYKQFNMLAEYELPNKEHPSCGQLVEEFCREMSHEDWKYMIDFIANDEDFDASTWCDTKRYNEILQNSELSERMCLDIEECYYKIINELCKGKRLSESATVENLDKICNDMLTNKKEWF